MRLSVVVILALIGTAPILGGILYLQGGDECSDCSTLAAPAVDAIADTTATTGWRGLSASRLDGRPFKMSDLVGMPVILDFWATWCPPCRKQREALHQLAGEYGERLRIVALSVDEDTAALKRYVAKHAGVTHELRASHDLLQLFGVNELPTLAIIDASGRVIHVSTGLMETAELRRIVAPLLK